MCFRAVGLGGIPVGRKEKSISLTHFVSFDVCFINLFLDLTLNGFFFSLLFECDFGLLLNGEVVGVGVERLPQL